MVDVHMERKHIFRHKLGHMINTWNLEEPSCHCLEHNTAVINKQINSQNFRDPFCFDFHKKNSRIFPTIASYFLFCLIKIKTKRITENSRTLPTSELCNKTIEVPICAFTTAEVYININIFFFYTDPNKKKEI